MYGPEIPNSAAPDTEKYLADIRNSISSAGSSLITEAYDYFEITYIVIGNGIGEPGVVVYKKNGNTVATLTINYDASDRIINVTKTTP